MSPLSRSLRVPLLCYVTDRRSLVSSETSEVPQPSDQRDTLLQKIAAAGAAGVDWIQIREKELSGKECGTLTREAMTLTASSSPPDSAKGSTSSKTEATREKVSTRILVNDRLDVALAEQAGGVHLGENSLPPEEAQRLVRTLDLEKDFLIGVSCHSLEAAKAAERGGAGYLFFGPVFATPSKDAYGAPQGPKRLAEICRAVAVPVLAIGGITLENAADCISAGASGLAAIRLFQDAPDVAAVIRTLRKLST